ncbi:hypothetical protein TNCV_5100981 [Trichonephila clavipes]|uniref:Uncharacterized protein n=1 Tax=Trichonephila clavipes TaxID=2585209 RepID=A0A8X6V7J3_TRICX|nr:hypothetical protein TNCV_5100981 [Trichonephila clavipes]
MTRVVLEMRMIWYQQENTVKYLVWEETKVVAQHSLEFDGWDCEQFMHFVSRVQSVEECPADAHLEQVSCPRQEVWECPNLWQLKQCRGFGM